MEIPNDANIGYPGRAAYESDEGFGDFRATWFIGRTTVAEATDVIRCESAIAEAIDRSSNDAATFEHLAKLVEDGEEPDDLAEWGGQATAGTHALRGLELGVAGLSYVLGNIGCLTAASCRSHTDEHSWSDAPCVLFGVHRWRALLMAPLVAQAGCGLVPARGMMSIYGPSIRNTMALAQLLFDRRADFRKRPDGQATNLRRAHRSNQLTLSID